MSVSPYGLKFQPVDINGSPYPGALLNCYAATTTTPQTAYSDAACTAALSNPVVADATGTFPAMYLSDALSYKFQLTDAAGNVLRTDDNVAGATGSVSAVSATTTPAIQGTNSGAGDGVYGKNAGAGYGIVAEAPTTTPTKAALRIVPQNSAPSSLSKGDVYVDNTTGILHVGDGTNDRAYLPADNGTATGLKANGVGATTGLTVTASSTSPATVVDAQTNGSSLAAERIVPQTVAPAGVAAIGDRYEDAAGRLLTSRAAGAGGAFWFVGAPGTRTVKTSGTPYVPTAGLSAISFTGAGAGGGGGAAESSGGNTGAGGGGAAGGVSTVMVFPPFAASYAIAYGVAGVGGVHGTNSGIGGTGGDTTVTPAGGGIILTAKGGLGGAEIGDVSSVLPVHGGSQQSGGIGGGIGGGSPGGTGTTGQNGVVFGGNGGSGPYGIGGTGATTSAAGGTASGNGAGGGGAAAAGSANNAGGVGTAGCLDIIEFF